MEANVHSIEELEVLLLLHRFPDRSWTTDEISRELYTSMESARLRLEHWVKAKIAERDPNGRCCLHKQIDGIQSMLNCLTLLYKQRRVTLIALIYSKPARPIREFSDAFRIKKEKRNDS